VLASVLVVTTGGLLTVVLVGRGGTPAPGTAAADVVPTPVAAPPTARVQPAPDTPEDRAARAGPTRPAVPPIDAAGLLASVDALARAAGGSIALVVLAPDGTPLVSGPAAGDVVYTASLVKLLVVGRLLELEAGGGLVLTDGDRALMERAIVASDDTAMSLLWDRFDGAALLTAASAAGLTGTRLPARPGAWGEATTTAADVAAVLAGLTTAAGSGPAATLLGWMRVTSVTAADGFDQHFGLLAGTDGTVAAKQGWMCCVDGTRQLHSAGVLPGGQVVVLLGDFPTSTSWATARVALDSAAAVVRTTVG
jgi:hypothetical protein